MYGRPSWKGCVEKQILYFFHKQAYGNFKGESRSLSELT